MVKISILLIYNWVFVKVSRVLYVIAGVVLLAEMAVILIDSGAHLIHVTSPFAGGAREVVELQMAILAALVLANTWFQGGHIRIDLVRSKLNYRYQCLIDAVAEVAGAIFAFAITYGVWRTFQFELLINARTDTLNIPIAPFQFLFLAIMLHFGILLFIASVQSAYKMRQHFKKI